MHFPTGTLFPLNPPSAGCFSYLIFQVQLAVSFSLNSSDCKFSLSLSLHLRLPSIQLQLSGCPGSALHRQHAFCQPKLHLWRHCTRVSDPQREFWTLQLQVILPNLSLGCQSPGSKQKTKNTLNSYAQVPFPKQIKTKVKSSWLKSQNISATPKESILNDIQYTELRRMIKV